MCDRPVSGSRLSPWRYLNVWRSTAPRTREYEIPFSQLRRAYFFAPNWSTAATSSNASKGRSSTGSLPPSSLAPVASLAATSTTALAGSPVRKVSTRCVASILSAGRSLWGFFIAYAAPLRVQRLRYPECYERAIRQVSDHSVHTLTTFAHAMSARGSALISSATTAAVYALHACSERTRASDATLAGSIAGTAGGSPANRPHPTRASAHANARITSTPGRRRACTSEGTTHRPRTRRRGPPGRAPERSSSGAPGAEGGGRGPRRQRRPRPDPGEST